MSTLESGSIGDKETRRPPHPRGIKRSLAGKAFAAVNGALLIVMGVVCLLPLLNVLAISFSSVFAVMEERVSFWPVELNFDAYIFVMNNERFMNSLLVSFQRIVLAGALYMIMVVLTAYPLSKEKNRFRFRNIYMWFFFFTMLFGGGLIPTYMVVAATGLIDSIWALILPGSVSIWLTILLLNFFRALPKAMEEAALMDGAGHLTILFRIYLPVSKAALATILLFILVGQWNEWFAGMIYLNNPKRYPLATYLRTILNPETTVHIENDETISRLGLDVDVETFRAAQIVVATVPILVAYPFLQKHFAKGIVMGSVKG